MLGAEGRSLEAMAGQCFETSEHSASAFAFTCGGSGAKHPRLPAFLMPFYERRGPSCPKKFPRTSGQSRGGRRGQLPLSWLRRTPDYRSSSVRHDCNARSVDKVRQQRLPTAENSVAAAPVKTMTRSSGLFSVFGFPAFAGPPDTSTYPATFLFKCLEAVMQASRLMRSVREAELDSPIIQAWH